MTADSVRCLVHGPATGARNMAVDEALMEAARDGAVTLRFYRWSPPCLSLGRHQAARDRYDDDAARTMGVDVVRRPTGGRAVYHHRELTYAVTAPADLWGGLRPAYRRINRALLRGLGRLGAAVEEAARRGPAPEPSSRACFRDPLPGEIVAAGRKLVGSAQWRERGAMLQHGSLLLHDDQAVAERLRARTGPGAGGAGGGDGARGGGGPGDGAGGKGAAGVGGGDRRAAALSDLLPELPSPRRLMEALRGGFREELGRPVEEGELAPSEEECARALEPRYRGDDWTWRR